MHVVWHRTELRIHDQPALHAALLSGQPILPLVIIDPIIFGRPNLTPRRQAWFLENARALRESYRKLGCDLVVRKGVPADVLAELAQQHPIQAVHFIQNHTPYAKERDQKATEALQAAGVEVFSYPGQYSHPPGSVLSQTGNRYGIFGPYGRKWTSLPKPELAPTPESLPPLPKGIEVGEIPTVAPEIELPPTGEAAALKQLETFLEAGEAGYDEARNFPARKPGTSLLSYYFNIGVLSPRVAARRSKHAKWKSELAWWDFNAEVLDKQPEGATLEYRELWRGFPWRNDEAETEKWKQGQTGFPFVDAGMRQLKQTGFMHNRARLITASFLTKHLMIDWRVGEDVFRGWLLCGDSAQNLGNWQWVAGCGYDAAPFFRVFNPVVQAEKFDPEAEYIKTWVPELRDLPTRLAHRPWLSQKPVVNYPAPMIDLKVGKDRYTQTAREFLAKRRQETGDKATRDIQEADAAEK